MKIYVKKIPVDRNICRLVFTNPKGEEIAEKETSNMQINDIVVQIRNIGHDGSKVFNDMNKQVGVISAGFFIGGRFESIDGSPLQVEREITIHRLTADVIRHGPGSDNLIDLD